METIKFNSNVSILNEELLIPARKICDILTLLKPDTYFNGKRTLEKNIGNTLDGVNCNTVFVCSANNIPFSININDSEFVLTNLYIYTYCGLDNISFEVYNDSETDDAEVNFFIGVTELLDNSYVYS